MTETTETIQHKDNREAMVAALRGTVAEARAFGMTAQEIRESMEQVVREID